MRRDAIARGRRGGSVAAVAILLAGAASLFGESARALELAAHTGVRYDAWSGPGSLSESQLQVPVTVQGRAGDFSAGLLAAYVYTALKGSEGQDPSLGTLVDTKLTTSYELVGRLPVDLLFGLDFNLPTGKVNLSEEELGLILDPDLVPVTSLGEGFNANPTITVAKGWGPVAAGLGFGYLWRGSYDLSRDLGLEDYDPGDVATVTGEARWAFAPAWEANGVGKYSFYGKDRLDGEDVFREGDFFSLRLGVRWSGGNRGASAAIQGIFRGKSEFPQPAGGLATEEKNSHGDEWRGTLAFQQTLDDRTLLTASLQGLILGENDYPESSPLFAGGREKVSLTLGAVRRLAPNVEGGVDLGGFLLRDDGARYPERRDEGTYWGLSAALRLTASF